MKKLFSKVYSQEQIDEIDSRIMEAKRKEDARLYFSLLGMKDFSMNK